MVSAVFPQLYSTRGGYGGFGGYSVDSTKIFRNRLAVGGGYIAVQGGYGRHRTSAAISSRCDRGAGGTDGTYKRTGLPSTRWSLRSHPSLRRMPPIRICAAFVRSGS